MGMAERFAKERGLKLKIVDANWRLDGRAAGVIRNELMANYGTHSISFWDGKSKGTADLIRRVNHRLLIHKTILI